MIYRVDVFAKAATDSRSDGEDVGGLVQMAREAGVAVSRAWTSRVFFIDADETEARMRQIALPLLVDEVVERGTLRWAGVEGQGKAGNVAVGEAPPWEQAGVGLLEVHLKPGVMDVVAASTEEALRAAGLRVRAVRTGRAYRFEPAPSPDQLTYLGARVLGNGVIEAVHLGALVPGAFSQPRVSPFELRQVPIRGLSDAELERLSRSGHLFLNLTEMRAIQAWYREQGREPTDVELETLAQTWSEHCVHKTLKSSVEVVDGVGGGRRYDNLIRDTIFASTQRLIAEGRASFCLSVFKDNAGVIALDDQDAVCFKVETHNRPSAIDPYGGAATGVGGCIRDVLGTGLGARPIANTDVFCVAYPDHWRGGGGGGGGADGRGVSQLGVSQLGGPQPGVLPPGVLHPKRVLTQVVAGVRDYGNRMGIPTVNGAVYFDDRYVANPLVFCGCVGLLPRDRIVKGARAGDAVVVIGGRTGRDGIHGATFSSAELTSTHADEFSHAVQIGNAITQKKMMDVVLQAAERKLYTAITDCGAGGLSSAVGEMGEKLGAEVQLDRVPLKYEGLRYDEVWISEAQERMVLAVPPENVGPLLALAASEDVEATVIGHFGTPGRELVLAYHGTVVGRLSMDFLHGGLPMPTRKAVVSVVEPGAGGEGWWGDLKAGTSERSGDAAGRLLRILAHPNVASKRFIVRQYDHEVQGMSVVKPLVGPWQQGPSDAAVLQPKPGSCLGVALGCGLCPWESDPYRMALAAVDEAVRNVVAVGADLSRVALLDNFCWPGTDNEQAMGDLVRTAEACRDAALAYGTPFISGKDSLHNQFTDRTTGRVIRIPNTLLVSAIGIVPDVRACVTMELKRPGSRLYRVGGLGMRSTPEERVAVHRQLAAWIGQGRVRACHDISDGGWLTAVSEMAIGGRLGVKLVTLDGAFAELVAGYVVEWAGEDAPGGATLLGEVTARPLLAFGSTASGDAMWAVEVERLASAWLGTLDW